jgi:Type VI secretion system/phage-baseplate injector OB domain
MANGYGGTYRGSVVDTADPFMQNRLRVLVPEISGSDAVWALPSLPTGDVVLPSVGDEVWVSFEHGDAAYPVWAASADVEESRPAASGYVGTYRGIVVDNADPLMQNRLQVSVPEVAGEGSAWATPGLSVGSDVQPPPVGAEVWVEYEGGDAAYPIWVGVR